MPSPFPSPIIITGHVPLMSEKPHFPTSVHFQAWALSQLSNLMFSHTKPLSKTSVSHMHAPTPAPQNEWLSVLFSFAFGFLCLPEDTVVHGSPPTWSNHEQLLSINNAVLSHAHFLQCLNSPLSLEADTPFSLSLSPSPSLCLWGCIDFHLTLPILDSLSSLAHSSVLGDCCTSSIKHSARVGWCKWQWEVPPVSWTPS